MGDEQPDRYMSVPDLAWSRVNASEWAWKCSMFASAVPWPKSVHPEEGAEAIHRRLAQWLTDSQGATRLADDEDDQVQLGLAFFSNHPQQSPAGAEPGPACFPYHPPSDWQSSSKISVGTRGSGSRAEDCECHQCVRCSLVP